MGGAERIVQELCSEGLNRGWQSVVIDPIARTKLDSKEWSSAALNLNMGKGRRLFRAVTSKRYVRRALAGDCPNIVHAHLLGGFLAASSAGDSATTIATHHHGDVYSGGWIIRWLDRFLTRRFFTVVAVSDGVRRYICESYGVDVSRVPVIHNGWAPRPTGAQPVKSDLICVGNLRREKGQMVLLRALKILRPSSTGHGKVLFLGEGPWRGRLERFSRKNGLSGIVDFPGHANDVSTAMSASRILVAPSLCESFGTAVLEGMAAGLPVIASRVGGLPELVQPGVTGELFTPGDHEELAGHLTRLLGDPELCRRMGAAGREVAQAYTMEKTVQQYYDLYEKLLADRSAAN